MRVNDSESMNPMHWCQTRRLELAFDFAVSKIHERSCVVKKGLVHILILALILSMISTVSAQETTSSEQKARVLYELNLFEGTNPNAFTPSLTIQTDRAQAMVMIGRADRKSVV